MSWCYRVHRHRSKAKKIGVVRIPSVTTYTIREVHLGEDDRPFGYSTSPDYPSGCTVDDLRADLVLMLLATSKPILAYKSERKR